MTDIENRLRETMRKGDLAAPPAEQFRFRRPTGQRRRLGPTVAVAAALLLLAGIVTASTAYRLGRHDDPSLAATTSTVVAPALQLWADFPVTASPRPIVLTGPKVVAPARGFATSEDKFAFMSGQFDVTVTLPTATTSRDGGTVISAADAITLLRRSGASNRPAPTRLSITEVRLGSATFWTDRGQRSLPAWEVAFKGVSDPAAVLALPDSEIWPPVMLLSDDGPVGAVTVSPDGREITLSFAGSRPGCGFDYSVEVATSNTAVMLALRSVPVPAPEPSTQPSCGLDIGYRRTVQVHLDEPLGNRVIIDENGAPLSAS